jgi:predicted Zn-dependent peptidase
MKIDPVSDEELQAAQKQVIEEFNRGLNSTDGLCNLMLDAELYHLGSNYAALFPDQVRRCDAETIKQAAKSWLFPGGEIVLMRGPTDVLKPLLETLGAVQPMPR